MVEHRIAAGIDRNIKRHSLGVRHLRIAALKRESRCRNGHGLSFVGTAGKFVVESPNLKGVIDINKSKDGVETCVLGENSMDELDARKAVAVLKLKMRKEK